MESRLDEAFVEPCICPVGCIQHITGSTNSNIVTVAVICSNESCKFPHILHKKCYIKWEECLLRQLRKVKFVQKHNEIKQLSLMWSVGYEYVYRSCKCRCGGYLKKCDSKENVHGENVDTAALSKAFESKSSKTMAKTPEFMLAIRSRQREKALAAASSESDKHRSANIDGEPIGDKLPVGMSLETAHKLCASKVQRSKYKKLSKCEKTASDESEETTPKSALQRSDSEESICSNWEALLSDCESYVDAKLDQLMSSEEDEKCQHQQESSSCCLENPKKPPSPPELRDENWTNFLQDVMQEIEAEKPKEEIGAEGNDCTIQADTTADTTISLGQQNAWFDGVIGVDFLLASSELRDCAHEQLEYFKL